MSEIDHSHSLFKLYAQHGTEILTCSLLGATTLLEGVVDVEELKKLKIGESYGPESDQGDIFVWHRIA